MTISLEAPMFKRMDHVAMSVRDIEGAIAFYRDVIGMEKIYDMDFDKPMARLLGIDRADVRIVHMKLDDFVLELFHYRNPEGKAPRPDKQQSDFGLTHIGFMVEDFWGTYNRLKDHGVQFLGEAMEFRPGVFVAYFHGVEYEVCEIREIISKAEGKDVTPKSLAKNRGVS
jgi:catechol 2,3-dioxygenase-like lactoylglutathione lyase family enzyme